MIFAENAPAYWEQGIPVIPLYRKAKNPIINQWQRYSTEMPSPEMQTAWLAQYKDGNIGLPLGSQSGMVAVDVDSDDPRLKKVLDAILPPSPWVRVGKKGYVKMYRWNNNRNTRIKTEEGATLVEILGNTNQVVLPPSIHPETKQPYSANANLWEIRDELIALPQNIEVLLREALIEEGFSLSVGGSFKTTDFTAAGSRDTSMTRYAGTMAHAILRGERSVYEAIGMMQSWCENFVESVHGDEIDVEKGKMKICEFLRRDVLEKKFMLPKGWDDQLSKEELEGLGLSFGSDSEAWDFDRMMEYLEREFRKHVGKDNTNRGPVVDYILQRMTNNDEINQLDQDRIFRWINRTCGGSISIAGMRKRLNQLEEGEINGTDQTELAKAVYEDLIQYGDIRYWQDKYWQWEGAFWAELPANDILRHIQDQYGAYQAAKKFSDHKGILGVMASQCYGPLSSTSEGGINFANGFLDENLQLHAHDAKYGQTYVLPFRYMPDASSRANRWFEFLENCWGADDDYQDKVAALQEAICVTLFGIATDFQRAIALHGVAKSGKSQILEVIQRLLPPNTKSNIPPTEWGDKFAPASMSNKLLNICGELSETRRIDGAKFKEIVTGESINGQFKNKDSFSFRPKCAQWFATNHLPATKDTSEGFNRRWLFLDFTRPVKKENRILRIGEILVAEEREEIVAWAVEALPRLRQNSEYTIPASHQFCLDEMANENNSVRFFLTRSGKVNIGANPLPENSKNTSPLTSCNDLHSEYYVFCLSVASVSPVRLNKFNKLMRDLAVELGYRTVIKLSELGEPLQYCENLTLIDATKKAS